MMGKNTIDRNLLIAYEKTHYIIDKILVKLQWHLVKKDCNCQFAYFIEKLFLIMEKIHWKFHQITKFP